MDTMVQRVAALAQRAEALKDGLPGRLQAAKDSAVVEIPDAVGTDLDRVEAALEAAEQAELPVA